MAQGYQEYDSGEGYGSRRRRGAEHGDWEADYEHPSHGLYDRQSRPAAPSGPGGYEDYEEYREPRRRSATASRQVAQGRGSSHSGYRRQEEDYYDEGGYADSGRGNGAGRDNGNGNGWHRRHPVIFNLLLIAGCAVVAVWLLMCFLDFWTFHGEEVAVPDFRHSPYTTAISTAQAAHIQPVLADSVFDAAVRPGTVVEQVPIPGARIKRGGMVYLTVVAFSPKMVTVPDFYNVSERQARSMFEGLGLSAVRAVPVPSEYEGLVLGARFNGVSLRPGARIPVSAVVTLEVGSGIDPALEEADSTGLDQAIDDAFEELNID